jgi:hypothetical protein
MTNPLRKKQKKEEDQNLPLLYRKSGMIKLLSVKKYLERKGNTLYYTTYRYIFNFQGFRIPDTHNINFFERLKLQGQ